MGSPCTCRRQVEHWEPPTAVLHSQDVQSAPVRLQWCGVIDIRAREALLEVPRTARPREACQGVTGNRPFTSHGRRGTSWFATRAPTSDGALTGRPAARKPSQGAKPALSSARWVGSCVGRGSTKTNASAVDRGYDSWQKLHRRGIDEIVWHLWYIYV
eukprot:scaffold7884_cov1398-Prasinococcus_capsulatus_cf.AAC.1